MRLYPSRNGVPVPTEEVGLAPSRLNPNNENNWNNHHLYFERRNYQPDPLFNALRNLERSQEVMLKDQHNIGKKALHSVFGPPLPPTPEQAMDQVEQAFIRGERMKILSQATGKYALWSISPKYFEELKQHYDSLRS